MSGGSPRNVVPASSPERGEGGKSPDTYHSPPLPTSVSKPAIAAPLLSAGRRIARILFSRRPSVQESEFPSNPWSTTRVAPSTARRTLLVSTGMDRAKAFPSETNLSGPARR